MPVNSSINSYAIHAIHFTSIQVRARLTQFHISRPQNQQELFTATHDRFLMQQFIKQLFLLHVFAPIFLPYKCMPISSPVSIRPIQQEEFAKLDYQVMRHAFESQNELGRLCDEVIYQNDLAAR
jgi:hypothetical protein